MTREEYLKALIPPIDEARLYILKEHDKEQRAEIARLKNDLSHWTFARFQQLESETKRLREALQDLINCIADECLLDHHGYCQTHFVTIPCIYQKSLNAIKETI